jgi:hypothetical protein
MNKRRGVNKKAVLIPVPKALLHGSFPRFPGFAEATVFLPYLTESVLVTVHIPALAEHGFSRSRWRSTRTFSAGC